MSCYGWEKGEVKLPTKEWKSFKTNLISKLQYRQEELLGKANALYDQVKTQKPKDKAQFIRSQLTRDQSSYGRDNFEYSENEVDKIIAALLKENRLRKPKASDFKIKKTEVSFQDQEIDVRLDNKTKMVYYRSDDNNHSIDVARGTYLGKTIIILLQRVNYSNRTGGYFESQTEYDTDEGRGANVSERFGSYKNKIRSTSWTAR